MKEKTKLIWGFAIVLILVIGILVFWYFYHSDECKDQCTQKSIEMVKEKRENMYQKISPQEAKEKMQKEDITLIDVRTKEEYDEGHIPNSKLLPLDEIEEKIEEQFPDKNKTIYIYCRSGSRSKTASMKLIEKGYQNVFDLGGIIDWPYEIEK